MRLLSSSMLVVTALLAGCSSGSSSPGTTSSESDLTQDHIAKLSDPALEALRQKFDAAQQGETGEFHGYAAAFTWKSDKAGAKLTQEQIDYLSNELVQAAPDTEHVSYYTDLRTEALIAKTALAEKELRLSAGAASAEVDAAVEAARAAGKIVSLYRPKVAVPGATPTAGALIAVDMKNLEAVVLYGRRGPAPIHIECTVDKMISYEWEEGFSKDEYPSVDIDEDPISGDILLDIGANSPYSNAAAIEDGLDYTMHVSRAGSKLIVEAKGAVEFFAKAEIDGSAGAVWGDNDGNNRPNKAATLKCTGK